MGVNGLRPRSTHRREPRSGENLILLLQKSTQIVSSRSFQVFNEP